MENSDGLKRNGLNKISFLLLKVYSIHVFISFFLLYSVSVAHEAVYLVGCFENGTTEAQFTFDDQEILYVNFMRDEIVYTVPRFLVLDPQDMFKNIYLYKNALKNKKACTVLVALEEKDEMIPDVEGEE